MKYKNKFFKYIFKINQIGGLWFRGENSLNATRIYDKKRRISFNIYEYMDRKNLLNDLYSQFSGLRQELRDTSSIDKLNPELFNYNDDILFQENTGFDLKINNFTEFKHFLNQDIFKNNLPVDELIKFFENKLIGNRTKIDISKFTIKKKYEIKINSEKTVEEIKNEFAKKESVENENVKIYIIKDGFPLIPISNPTTKLKNGEKIMVYIMEMENIEEKILLPDSLCIIKFYPGASAHNLEIIYIIDGKIYYTIVSV